MAAAAQRWPRAAAAVTHRCIKQALLQQSAGAWPPLSSTAEASWGLCQWSRGMPCRRMASSAAEKAKHMNSPELPGSTEPDSSGGSSSSSSGSSGSSDSSSGSSGRGRAGVGSPIGWTGLGLAAITGAGLLTFYQYEKERRMSDLFNNKKQRAVAGKAALGGPFELVNQDGKKVTQEDLKGQFSLLYFGFTHCPDICPDELIKISEATDIIHKQTSKDKFRPVFISIDPERDDVEQVKGYVEDFHPQLWGFTGSVEACKDAARQYRVYYHKTEEESDGDYLVDHSIIHYLVDPAGDFVSFFGKQFSAEQMAAAISEEIQKWQWS